jgi:phosphoglucomutase
MAASCRARGITLVEALEELYQKYGYWKEGLMTVKLSGQDGRLKRQKLMEAMRSEALTEIGGRNILAVRDYKSGLRTDRSTHRTSDTGLPVSDVVYYELDGGWCCARPSGTEPKVKFYFGVCEETAEAAEEGLAALRQALEALAA